MVASQKIFSKQINRLGELQRVDLTLGGPLYSSNDFACHVDISNLSKNRTIIYEHSMLARDFKRFTALLPDGDVPTEENALKNQWNNDAIAALSARLPTTTRGPQIVRVQSP